MRGFLLARAASVRLRAAVLLGGALVGQTFAADIVPPRPLADSSMRAPSTAAAQPPSKQQVIWPENGIAQRRLDGGFNYNMFVENDNGTWRAWVQSDMSDPVKKDWTKAKALEFFSGQELVVEASVYDETHQQAPGFRDHKGKAHGPQDRSFQLNRGAYVKDLRRGADFSFSAEHCQDGFLSFQGGITYDWVFRPSWTKIPLILDESHSRSGSTCANGSLSSSINSTLDLNDGTFLVTMECWVFRLRKSDLSPVGAAPALRVVDEVAMKAAIDKAQGQHIKNATAYLTRALGLRFDKADACTRAPAN